MKNFAITVALTILMASSVSSCGKKANEHSGSSGTDKSDPFEIDLIEETHNDVAEAIRRHDQAQALKLLALKTQIDLNKVLEDGETLLTLAVSFDLTRIVEELIENGASLYKTNSRRENALMVASRNGHTGLVKVLIALGAKLDSKDIDGNTALQLAIINRHEDIAMYLIEKGANIDITNNQHQTALRLAEILDLKKVLAYLRSKAQSNIGMPSELTLIDLLTLGDAETIQQLFIKYENLLMAYPNLNYYVLVMNAHSHDKALGMIQLLMALGVSVHGPLTTSETPLLCAVKKNDETFAELFLQARANPDVVDENGKTALIWAIQRNNPELVRILLRYNAAKKYDYYLNGKKKTMKACDIVKDVKKLVSDSEGKWANEEIKDILGCGFLGLF